MSRTSSTRILVIAGRNFLHAYSGTQYLAESLGRRGFDVTVMCRQLSRHPMEASSPFPFQCIGGQVFPDDTRWGNRLNSGLHRLRVFIRGLLFHRVVIVTELAYLREAAWCRRLKPWSRLVHYCQELYTKKEYPDSKEAAYYERLARIPDLVVDVEPNRARVRKEHFDLPVIPWILTNTLPARRIPAPASPGSLARLAGTSLPDGVPVVLYIGGIGKEKPLERIIEAVQTAESDTFLLAFCRATPGRRAEIRRFAEGRLPGNRHQICNPVSRDDLLACAHEASVGVIDYPYSIQPSQNQMYCAPTKLYEYMALGLPVLTSGNVSLRPIVEGERIGVCAGNDEVSSLATALDQLISSGPLRKDMSRRASRLFRDKYSYEKLCEPVLDRMEAYLRSSFNPGDSSPSEDGPQG